MTLKQFTEFQEIEQVRMLLMYGVLLSNRTQGGNKIYLYAVNSFYIELFEEISNCLTPGLRILRCFDDVKFLEDYLSDIEIPQFS